MDVVVLCIIIGVGLLGAFWGFVRLVSVLLALTGASFLGRLAGPPLAELVFPSGATSFSRLLASLVVAALTGVLLLLAGAGVRRLLQSLHLSFLDRLLGALTSAGFALLLVALLLGLAAMSGFRPRSRLSAQLAEAGQGILAVYKLANSSTSPPNSPSKPTNNGQQPEEP